MSEFADAFEALGHNATLPPRKNRDDGAPVAAYPQVKCRQWYLRRSAVSRAEKCESLGHPSISRKVRMKSQLLILAAVFIFFVPREPLAAPEQQMCVCQFVAPVYRPFVRQTNIEGTVRVTVLFDSDGKPTTVTR
jgi:hypothetical protein